MVAMEYIAEFLMDFCDRKGGLQPMSSCCTSALGTALCEDDHDTTARPTGMFVLEQSEALDRGYRAEIGTTANLAA